jgi:hypothetical protein
VDYNYWNDQPTACPQCGSTADVRTVQELVGMFDGTQQPAAQAREQYQQPRQRSGRGFGDSDLGWESPDQQIADAVLGAATSFLGKAIGKRMRRVYEERVVPNLRAQAEQRGQDLHAQAEQRGQDLHAIAERYPELRGCLRDQVIFLSGGTRTIPLSEVSPQISLTQADALVTRLRTP